MAQNLPDSIPFGSPPIISNTAPSNAPESIPFGSSPIAPMSASTQAVPDASTPDTFSEIGNSIVNTAKDLNRARTNINATPIQLVAKVLGLNDPYAGGAIPSSDISGIPIPGGADQGGVAVSSISPAGFLQKGGDVLNLGSMVLAPEAAGARRLAAIGATSAIGQSLASGETDPSNIVKNGIWGGMFGFGVGLGGNFFSHIAESEALRTGVVGVNKDAIANSSESLVSKYINAAKNHGETMADLRSPTPVGLMENEFNKRASILTDTVIPKAGEAVGAAKKSAATTPIMISTPGAAPVAGADAANTLFNDINNKVMEMTGHGFGLVGDVPETLPGLGVSSSARSPALYQLPGREVQLTPSEEKQLESLMGYLGRLKQKPTAGVASDLLTNINKEIDWKDQQFGVANSPVQGVMKYAYGAINNAIRGASPELAIANATYHGLMGLKDAISSSAGKEGQSAALMMRRVLSGDKSASVIPLLDQLDQITAPFRTGDPTTLVQHSILGKWATDMFGSAGTKQLFAEGVKEGQSMASGMASVFGYPRQFMQRQLNKFFTAIAPDAAKYALSVARGEPYSMNAFTRLMDAEMNTPVVSNLLDGIHSKLKDMGVTAHNLEPAAKAIFKTWLINRLSQPKAVGFPNYGNPAPMVSTPPDVPQVSPQPQSMAPAGRNLSAAPIAAASTAKSLTPASTGQGMASQSRNLGLGAMPSGMNLSGTKMGLS